MRVLPTLPQSPTDDGEPDGLGLARERVVVEQVKVGRRGRGDRGARGREEHTEVGLRTDDVYRKARPLVVLADLKGKEEKWQQKGTLGDRLWGLITTSKIIV